MRSSGAGLWAGRWAAEMVGGYGFKDIIKDERMGLVGLLHHHPPNPPFATPGNRQLNDFSWSHKKL